MNAEAQNRAHLVQLCGALDVRSIDTARDRILDALREHDVVVADCAQVTAADLSAVQLLLAAHRCAEAWGKTFALATPAGGALREVLVRGGFLLDGADGPGNRFWNEGSAAA
ncbi:MAG TPA: STAS domain-containing protein [Azospirillum sp.]|nr:STAS domain-containing protein [Azospirillum sp.]